MLNRASCGRGAVSHPQTLKAKEMAPAVELVQRWGEPSWRRARRLQLMGMPDPGRSCTPSLLSLRLFSSTLCPH